MKKIKIKKGDTVEVISGSSKGKRGVVKSVLYGKDRVVVDNVNLVSKHLKPTSNNPQGKIDKLESPIHISNVSLLDPKSDKPTRVGYRFDGENKIRYSKKSGEAI
ncbi:50S ribosomal protein L24 [Ichthyobacterium seriolicida]|uniref:Large ribosomal subunit protein uL24 n=1 Tax=Ichthyobacterium seriolicida TaxID=242600 RepID=A0A1J1EA63_9FLAO|nr:50S ribosomal protein L24 [Ichthyobacterium seriolicida]BAV94819.1 50S ribosomal protein L24 [Ichthyobacterium seriolicida]